MNEVNQKIIDAVIAKAARECPGSLLLIGVYGSVATGDLHARSDLDLLILIRDEDGRCLAEGFILEDGEIGYDIYCTTFENLRGDAECRHAHLAKLMDSEIVYIGDEEAYRELCVLRGKARDFLASDARCERARELIDCAKMCYADALLHREIGEVRMDAFKTVSLLSDALMIYHGVYFRRGVKRMREELASASVGDEYLNAVKRIAACRDTEELRALLASILSYAISHTEREKRKKALSEDLRGTYEEMYSNWRNKIFEAAERASTVDSFFNTCCMQNMLDELAAEYEIGTYRLTEEYDPECLEENVKTADACLDSYKKACIRAGVEIRSFSDVDAFVSDYLYR